MIGQNKLQNKLFQYNLETLPKTILFMGPNGCGKHTLLNEIARKLYMDIIELDVAHTTDDLIDFQQQPIPTFFLIDLNKFTEKQQNQFLKFIEEPGKNVFICLIASSPIGILPTVLNRCQIYHFEPYSIEQLRNIKSYDNELIYNVCKTPGQLLEVDINQFTALASFCKSVLDYISTVPIGNALNIANKLNFKEEYDKFDYDLFLRTLLVLACNRYITNDDKVARLIYIKTVVYLQRLQYKTLNKETFMINYLLYIKEALNG